MSRMMIITMMTVMIMMIMMMTMIMNFSDCKTVTAEVFSGIPQSRAEKLKILQKRRHRQEIKV